MRTFKNLSTLRTLSTLSTFENVKYFVRFALLPIHAPSRSGRNAVVAPFLQHQGHHGHEFGADVAFQEMHGKQRPAAAAALFVANDVFRQSTQQLGLDHLFGGGGTGGNAVKRCRERAVGC